MKNLKIILCMFFSSSLIAEPIDLICVKKFDQEFVRKSWFNWDTQSRKCEEKKNTLAGIAMGECNFPHINQQRWEKCKDSEIAFQYKFRLDTKDIENGSGLAENTITQNCLQLRYNTSFYVDDAKNYDGKVILFNINVTPSYIMFSEWERFNDLFQVDRKTLIAEHKQKELTNFVCSIEEVKEKKNLL